MNRGSEAACEYHISKSTDEVIRKLPKTAAHVDPELRAFRTQAQFWKKLYPYGKLPERCPTDHMNNQIVGEWLEGSLDQNISRIYTQQWYDFHRYDRDAA